MSWESVESPAGEEYGCQANFGDDILNNMSNAQQMIALLKSHFQGDDRQFCSVAM